MTKARTQGEKRRAKKGRVTDLYEQWREEAVIPVEVDNPTETVLNARARRLNAEPDRCFLGEMFGEDAGIAIHLGAKGLDEANTLWSLFKRYDRHDETFHRLVIGKPRFPAVSKLEFMPERMETRADDVIDTRTQDERIRDARNDKARWDGLLERLYPFQRIIIKRATRHMETLHERGALTSAGRSFVAAMRALSEVEK